MKFRKKPVVIEATQWFKDGDHPAVVWPIPGVSKKADGRCENCMEAHGKHGAVKTLESGGGFHTVCPGDFIITGVKGEHYPCKPDIFKATYEQVEPQGQDRREVCPACDPKRDGINYEGCDICKGTGRKPKSEVCERCEGNKGWTNENNDWVECQACDGTGRKPKSE